MSKKLLNLLGYTVTVAFLSWILYRFHDQTDWSLVLKLFQHPFLTSVHFLLLFGTYAFFLLGWHFLLTNRQVRCTFWKAAAIWLIPNLGKYIPGRVFLPMARTELLYRNGVTRGHAFAYFLLEQCITVIGTLPFALMPAVFFLKRESPLVLLLSASATLIFLFLAARPNLIVHTLNIGLRLLKRTPLDPDFARIPTLRLTLLYSLGWLSYGLSGLVLASSLELHLDNLALALPCALIAAWLIGFLSILTPGGLGIRETATVALLAPFLPGPDALILAFVLRFSWTLMEVLGVALGIIIYRKIHT
ncbi:conserved membrane hypothetical protein [uncultured Desulfatiglans sp.]|nr:conserved membrane hypothetical protein [uncultured Desulfatiglans sp.]